MEEVGGFRVVWGRFKYAELYGAAWRCRVVLKR